MSVEVQRVMGETICYIGGNGHSILSCEKGSPHTLSVYNISILIPHEISEAKHYTSHSLD